MVENQVSEKIDERKRREKIIDDELYLNSLRLRNVNAAITTIDISGKPYAEVNQRIKAFRCIHPNGRILTEILKLEDGMCLMKASAFDEVGTLLATGHAYEKEGANFINKTSYIENCETSAVGRCLAMCGIGIDSSVASEEEVTNAMVQQGKVKNQEVLDGKAIQFIDDFAFRHPEYKQRIMNKYQVQKWHEVFKLSEINLDALITDLKKAEKVLEKKKEEKGSYSQEEKN